MEVTRVPKDGRFVVSVDGVVFEPNTTSDAWFQYFLLSPQGCHKCGGKLTVKALFDGVSLIVCPKCLVGVVKYQRGLYTRQVAKYIGNAQLPIPSLRWVTSGRIVGVLLPLSPSLPALLAHFPTCPTKTFLLQQDLEGPRRWVSAPLTTFRPNPLDENTIYQLPLAKQPVGGYEWQEALHPIYHFLTLGSGPAKTEQYCSFVEMQEFFSLSSNSSTKMIREMLEKSWPSSVRWFEKWKVLDETKS